ncbi:hypothetical protein E3T39_15600 [Cryobacterium suzukii]|uniref:Lipoprotein n=1 Tax=Cryobacterium suzukii TaxID=1259198 RepID=A0A4R9ABY2_9MICO|nr:hypothetical protein [Cryobacterium suzukii]TFD56760.1 hypothetical protein E3T39_15600 [Cryobacterium suzukii]
MIRAPRAIALALLATLALSGCSAAESASPREETTNTTGQFTGPYSDIFEAALQNATSDDVALALVDESITEQEYSYFQSKLIDCFTSLGLTASFKTNGQLSYSGPETSQEKIQACNAENGVDVLALHDAIVRNPARLDEADIVLKCLQDTGVVDNGYSIADYENGVNLSAMIETDEFEGCRTDPLNYSSRSQ